MDIVGYALIKKDATTGTSTEPISSFTKQAVRVMEFGKDGCVLVINPEATGIATFDKCDVLSSFECSISGEVICPPKLDIMQQMLYQQKAMSRKGGYNHIVRQLVIAASLHRKEFCDSVLWQKQ